MSLSKHLTEHNLHRTFPGQTFLHINNLFLHVDHLFLRPSLHPRAKFIFPLSIHTHIHRYNIE